MPAVTTGSLPVHVSVLDSSKATYGAAHGVTGLQVAFIDLQKFTS